MSAASSSNCNSTTTIGFASSSLDSGSGALTSSSSSDAVIGFGSSSTNSNIFTFSSNIGNVGSSTEVAPLQVREISNSNLSL